MGDSAHASDAAFVVDANIDQKAMRAHVTRLGSGSSRTGEWDVLAARGGFDPDVVRDDATERQPLLGSSGQEPGGDESEVPRYDEFNDLPWYRRPSIYWVLFPFSILAISFGGIITPRVNLIINLICQEYFDEQDSLTPGLIRAPILLSGSNPQCNIPEVSSRSSMFTLYGNLIAGLLSAFTSPKLGALSDRYGRTKMIAITSIGSLSGDIIFILAASRPDLVSVNWILVGFALDGLCGSFTTAMAIVHAYATDCVPASVRNVAFGYFHGCLFTGLAVGPILAGLLTKHTGTPVTSFYIMLGVHIFFILFMFFVCPESLSRRRQQHARDKHRQAKLHHSTDWIESLREINLIAPLKVLWPTGPGATSDLRRNLVLLASIDTLVFGVAMGSMTVTLIYVRQVFGWETYESSIFMTIVNITRVAGLFIALPVLTRIFRGKPDPTKIHKTGSDLFDLVVIRVAIFFDTLGYLGYALSTTGPMMIMSGVVASFGGMGSPTLQSALTKHVPPEKTGQLLGATGLLHALARVVAPTIFNGIFSATAATFVQTVFVCLTATFVLAFAFSLFVKPGVTLDPTKAAQNEADEEAAPLTMHRSQ
ncbi:major facilitator superfamily transporter [Myriangium duriaei CBS 260.36]|uniref:Major facilitator superfamily transporter n=1 Tax=Myriangium duriaei CBS 260.36 TaxID=1168546 RepID=A0A9P4MF06_9PEZI|nr:major facilitator superfamily transporter [Myriangium duriaei CBS 260.36]